MSDVVTFGEVMLRLTTPGTYTVVARAKNGVPSVHPLTGTELRALRRLQREQEPGRYVFMSERGAPVSAVGFRRIDVHALLDRRENFGPRTIGRLDVGFECAPHDERSATQPNLWEELTQ